MIMSHSDSDAYTITNQDIRDWKIEIRMGVL